MNWVPDVPERRTVSYPLRVDVIHIYARNQPMNIIDDDPTSAATAVQSHAREANLGLVDIKNYTRPS